MSTEATPPSLRLTDTKATPLSLVQCVTDVLSEFCRCVMCNKKVCSPARSPQRANHPGLSEVDFLLLMWFLLYCLFVLPHMDIRTISRFLLNLDE